MNESNRKLLPTFAFLVTTALTTSVAASPVDCSRPSDSGEARACKAAANSVDELRQFIQRTQGIYILYIKDFSAAVPEKMSSADDRLVRSN